MNIHKLFPSKWVGAADLEGKTPTLNIRALTIEEVGAPPNTEEKPVMWFEGATKGLILNKTNGLAVAALYGPETDNWVGRPVQMYTAKVRAFGATHDAIRLRSAGTVSAAPPPVHDAEPEDIAEWEGDELAHITLDDITDEEAARIGNGSQTVTQWEAEGPDVGDGGDGPKLNAADHKAMQAAVLDGIDADNPFDGITSREQETLDAWNGKTFVEIQQYMVDSDMAANLAAAKKMYLEAKASVIGDKAHVTKESAPEIKLALIRQSA